MDLLSPSMVALYIILGAFVLTFLYITIYGNRLALLSRQSGPDSFQQKQSEQKPKQSQSPTPLYPQRVSIRGYTIEPQPQNINVSNELVRTTVRKVCSIDDDSCSH